MAYGYYVRKDVLATIRCAMNRAFLIGRHPVEKSLVLLRRFAARYEPSAADATDEEWLNGLRALRRWSPGADTVWWDEMYDYSNY